MMPKKKYYPDMKKLQSNSRKACAAIKKLSVIGIEVISVDFTNDAPLVSIADCANNRFLNGAEHGIVASADNLFIKKVAILDGCRIFWHEAI